MIYIYIYIYVCLFCWVVRAPSPEDAEAPIILSRNATEGEIASSKTLLASAGRKDAKILTDYRKVMLEVLRSKKIIKDEPVVATAKAKAKAKSKANSLYCICCV